MTHGYDGASLSGIVGKSGVSKGGFYHYFTSKTEIYHEVIQTYFLEPLRQYDAGALAELSPRQARAHLREHYATISQQIRTMTEQGGTRYFSMMFEAISRLPDVEQEISCLYKKLLKNLARSLAKGKKPARRHKKRARRFVARLEGELYLNAVLELSEASSTKK